VDMGTRRIGIWKIHGGQALQIQGKKQIARLLGGVDVGDTISLRNNKGDTHFIAVVEKHSTN
jgi:hypothetical protein